MQIYKIYIIGGYLLIVSVNIALISTIAPAAFVVVFCRRSPDLSTKLQIRLN